MYRSFKLDCAGKILDLGKTRVMGVLNVTPDSFYLSSRCGRLDEALEKAEKMLLAGADLLDVGGESTSKMVKKYGYINDAERCVGGQSAGSKGDTANCAQELERVVPVVEALVSRFDCIVSVDTSSAEVMREAACAGAGMINDVRALERDGALKVAAETKLPVVLMHSLVDHPEPNFVPYYDDLMTEVAWYHKQRVDICEKAGIPKERLLIDPGFGGGLFGKTPAYDLSMLKHFDRFHELGLPVLAGMSRKSFIGATLDRDPNDRLPGSLAVALMACQKGAHIIRAHDVLETCDVLRMLEAVNQAM